MRSSLLLSLAFVAGVAGCGDHGTPNNDLAATADMSAGGDDLSVGDMGIPDDAKHNVSYTEFEHAFAQALCTHYVSCGELDQAQMDLCIANNLRPSGWDQDIEITKGRLEINDLQCLDALAASRCDESDSGYWAQRCGQFLYTGNQALGDTCVAAVECKTGYCQHGASDAGMTDQPEGCSGICATRKAAGSTCRLSTECMVGSYCNQSTHTCTKLAMSGESCTNFFGTGSGMPCAFGLLCPLFSSTPTCQAPPATAPLHAACDPYQGVSTPTPSCGAGLYCQLHYTATATTCTANNNCTDAGAFCDTTAGVCNKPTGATCENKIATGGSCDPNNEGGFYFAESQCADGTHCAQLPGQTTTTCQPWVAANGDCSSSNQCKVGLQCVGGKCTPWIADGQACATSGATAVQCASVNLSGGNSCIADNPDAGTATTCQAAKPFGATCIPGTEDSLCVPSDLVGSTTCAPTGSGSGICAPKCF